MITNWILALIVGIVGCILEEYEKTDLDKTPKERIRRANIVLVITLVLIFFTTNFVIKESEKIQLKEVKNAKLIITSG